MSRFCLIASVLIAASAVLEAKGTTVKLTLTGPGLANAVAIVDPAILGGSNVWDGRFIGDTLIAAPTVKPGIYTLAFDVRLPEWMRQGIKTMYTVSLARDAKTGELLLYLPGRGEPGYPRNVGTMLRDGQDGHWHRPSLAWATAIAKYMP
jgi:hypothetical protein